MWIDGSDGIFHWRSDSILILRIKSNLIKKVDVDFEEYGHSLCIVDTKGLMQI